MTEIMETLAALSVMIFVIGSMASMGLSLKVHQILAPLKNVKLVVMALVDNLILVPIVAYVITMVIPLDEPLRIGLILFGLVGVWFVLSRPTTEVEVARREAAATTS